MSYRDTFVVLAEQGILRKEDLPKFEKIASLRNLIVHYYERLDDEIVYSVLKKNLSDFDLFVKRILEYLEKSDQKYPHKPQ